MKSILFFTHYKSDHLSKPIYDSNDFIVKYFEPTIENLIECSQNNNNSRSIFISDNSSFLQIAFRLYNQTFDNFIYISGKGKYSPSLYDDYKVFINQPIQKNEHIDKRLYLIGDSKKIKLNVKQKRIRGLDEIQSSIQEKTQKVYYYNNKYLITEYINFKYIIIAVDDSRSNPKKLNVQDIFYNLDVNLSNRMTQILALLNNSDIDERESALDKILNNINKFSKYEQEKLIIHFGLLVNTLANSLSNENIKTLLYSYLVHMNYFSTDMFNSLLEDVCNSNNLTPHNKYFLFWQYLRIDFVKPLEEKADQEFLWLLYKNVYKNFKPILKDYDFIPKEQRNKDLIFIFTNQLLSELHAPTRMVLERAYSLKTEFNKQVLIINTAEVLTTRGLMPFYKGTMANKVEQYSTINRIQYKDALIHAYQCDVEMPDENEMLNILNIVNEYKPYFIFSFGAGNVTCDLASNLVTTVSFPLTSNLAISESQIHIMRSNLTEKNLQFIEKVNVDLDSIIISQPQGEAKSRVNFKKEDFNLPSDKFLLSVIGNRLTEEITKEFISLLLETITCNTHIVFIGSFDNYSDYCKEFKNLNSNSTLLSFQENLFDVVKLFDLFVNPSRIGGGTGGYYTVMNGLPLITLDYGDVHTTTDGLFSVKTYSEMKEVIIKYATDNEFYKAQCKKSDEFSMSRLSIKDEVSQILKDIESNKFFY